MDVEYEDDRDQLVFANCEFSAVSGFGTTRVGPPSPRIRCAGSSRQRMIGSTVAHEFTHCLGVAHNCGYRDYTANAACAMTYGSYWLRSYPDTLIPWSNGPSAGKLCAPHIKAIRQTRLEEEGPGLKLGW